MQISLSKEKEKLLKEMLFEFEQAKKTDGNGQIMFTEAATTKEQFEVRLKRCPFCGNEARLEAKKSRKGVFIAAKCKICLAAGRTAHVEADPNEVGWRHPEVTARTENVIAYWNCRVKNGKKLETYKEMIYKPE